MEYRPESIIVEIPGLTNENEKEILERCNLLSKCVEGPYAYKRAIENQISKVSGEPTDLLVYKESVAFGMTPREYLFFDAFRSVATWRQNEPSRAYNPIDPVREIKTYIENDMKRINYDGDFSYFQACS